MDWRPTAAGADDAHSRAALPCRAGPPADSRLQTAELEGGVKTKRRVALVTGAASESAERVSNSWLAQA